jgi:hypothetical protein
MPLLGSAVASGKFGRVQVTALPELDDELLDEDELEELLDEELLDELEDELLLEDEELLDDEDPPPAFPPQATSPATIAAK